jgi:polysaccharide export outer membrane protein
VAEPAGDQVIQPRDTLLVNASNQKDVSGEFVVREDGTYLQPPIGNVHAAGMTAAGLAKDLRRRLEGMIVRPDIVVSIPKRATIRVHVVGEVKTPASYDLERDRSVTAALAAAGWITEYANADSIYVLRPKEQVGRIRFRAKDLKTGEPRSVLFELRDGDVIVVE